MPECPLNSDLRFEDAAADVRRAFLGQRAEKRMFHAGYELFKFTEHPLFDSHGRATPWWGSVEPTTSNDPGLSGTLERAQRLGVLPADFARARSAVTRQWNRMSGLLVARLLYPAYGFVGRCSSQTFDQGEDYKSVRFIGGGYQIWMPNLTRREIAEE